MDQFTPELLKTVYELLPWKDRLATRRLSSQFRSLIPYPARLVVLEIVQNKNTVSFHLMPKKSSNEPIETIEIVKATQKTDFVYSKSSTEENGRQVRKMTVHCTRPNYHRLVDVYINFILSTFYFHFLNMNNLNDNFLAKIRKSFHKTNFDWKEEQRHIHLQTGTRTVSQKQRKFMNFCKEPRSFRFSASKDFQAPKDFWQLGAIKRTNQLFLEFGTPIVGPTSCIVCNVDVGVNDDFVRKLVDREMVSFMCNGKATISFSYLKEYITSCLEGGHALYTLHFSYKHADIQFREVRDYLSDCGFRKQEGRFIAPIRRPAKEGYHPDQLIVYLGFEIIQVMGDTAMHRGKISMTDESHCTLINQ